jgi:hypothetical protein
MFEKKWNRRFLKNPNIHTTLEQSRLEQDLPELKSKQEGLHTSQRTLSAREAKEDLGEGVV